MTSTKAIILRAASKLLNESGVDAVTVRSVADASNYGRSTVTHHFPDKDNLFDALHLVALEAFVVHISQARFGPAFAQKNLNAREELRTHIESSIPDDVSAEAGINVYRRYREQNPGYWELLRFRRCPDFAQEDAPVTWDLLMMLCSGELDAPASLTVDLIIHQLFSLHDWISQAKPEAVMRILHIEPSLDYWLSALR